MVTGGGALTLPADAASGGGSAGVRRLAIERLSGQLLTGSYPDFTVASTGWRASSKDHMHSSPGKVQAFAVNVKFN